MSFLILTTCLVDIAIVAEREIRFSFVLDSDIFPTNFLLERIINGLTFQLFETYHMTCFSDVYF